MKNSTKKQSHHQMHVPERSCIACRGKMAKRGLIRIVGNADAVKIDPKGKEAGRGAYLCPIRECWEVGLKGNRLEHALRVKLTLGNRRVLVEYGRSLPKRESQG